MMKEQLIEILTESGSYISGEDISVRLGISRAAVWKRIQMLREEGYVISSRTNKGYRLEALPDKLSAERIFKASGLTANEAVLYCHETLSSTSTEIKKYADPDNSQVMTAVFAEEQSAGRGRLGRSFYSPAGMGLYMSVMLKPESIESIAGITCMTAVAVCRAIGRLCAISPEIKWTNDIMYNAKKLCGILTELSSEGESGRLRYIIIGIGVNINETEFPDELSERASSLYLITGESQDRNRLAGYILAELWGMYRELSSKRAAYMDEYRIRCMNLGHEVEFMLNGEMCRGEAYGISGEGALLVRFPDGNTHSIGFGEASIISRGEVR